MDFLNLVMEVDMRAIDIKDKRVISELMILSTIHKIEENQKIISAFMKIYLYFVKSRQKYSESKLSFLI